MSGEILRILLTVYLWVMDISEFDVILGMDWLMAHRVVINCDHRRVTAYTQDSDCVLFQRNKHDVLPQAVYDSRWHGQLMGWLAGLTLEDEVRRDLSLPRVVCEYEDVFRDELPGLPSHRDVDFIIEFTVKNIGFDGYIGTLILQIYRKYIAEYFYTNIDISKINKNTLKFMEILCKSVKMTLIIKYTH